MKRNLKQELKAFYQSIPPMPNADLAVQLTKRAGRNALTPPKNFSLYQFIRTQARFLNRKLLALQLLLLCLYALYTIAVLQDNDRFLLFVPIAPLAVLLGTGELSRSSRYGMAELELPAHFSLPQILLARLILITLVDLFSLTCMLCLTAMKTYYSLGALILYGLGAEPAAAAGSLFLKIASGAQTPNTIYQHTVLACLPSVRSLSICGRNGTLAQQRLSGCLYWRSVL